MLARPIVLPLVSPITRSVFGMARGGGWSPLKLFASGEQGAWYDPSDLSSLYQDSAGTLPVTALGQPVGLMLDKRYGLVRGPELVTNGGPFTSLDGWFAAGSSEPSIELDGEEVKFNANTGGNTASFGPIDVVTGKWYLVAYELRSDGGRSTTVSLRNSTASVDVSTGVGVVVPTTPLRGFALLQGTSSVANGRLTIRASGAGIVWCKVASVRELPGNHASQPTATARPIITAGNRLDYDAVDDKLTTTFPNLGANVTIARAVPGVGASILTGQTIGAGARDDNTDHCGLLIINRGLTPDETAKVTAYLNAKAGA